MTTILCYRGVSGVARWSSRPSTFLATSSHLRKSWAVRSESSTSTSTTATTTSSSTTTLNNQDSPVNGPISTRPAPIILPSREANENILKFLFRRAKIYYRFYKTGLVNIWHNYRRSRELSKLITTQASNSLANAVSSNLVTRSDLLLLHRSKHDITRLPLFGLIFIILGEWTPVIVPFMTPIVPLTCRLPGQIESAIRKLEERRSASFRALTTPPPPPPASDTKLEDLRPDQLRHVSASLGLHSQYWPPFAPPPAWLLRPRVKRRIEYLHLDDSALLKHGGPEKVVRELDPEELQMALVERGLDTLGRNDGQRREGLRRWLGFVPAGSKANERAKEGVYCRLFLTRPSAWMDRKVLS